jgi:hypothetical protein
MARSVSSFRSWWSMLLVLGLVVVGASACVDQATSEPNPEETPGEAMRGDLRTRGPYVRARAPEVRATVRAKSPGRIQAELRARAALQ